MDNPLVQQQLSVVTKLRSKLEREEEALLTLMQICKYTKLSSTTNNRQHNIENHSINEDH